MCAVAEACRRGRAQRAHSAARHNISAKRAPKRQTRYVRTAACCGIALQAPTARAVEWARRACASCVHHAMRAHTEWNAAGRRRAGVCHANRALTGHTESGAGTRARASARLARFVRKDFTRRDAAGSVQERASLARTRLAPQACSVLDVVTDLRVRASRSGSRWRPRLRYACVGSAQSLDRERWRDELENLLCFCAPSVGGLADCCCCWARSPLNIALT